MPLTEAIELAGGWHFDSFHVPGVLNVVAGCISRWNPSDICRNFAALRTSIDWQELDRGVEWSGAMCVSLGRELVREAVARTSERTYQGYFRCWKLFRVSVGQPVVLLAGASGDSHVPSLLAYIAYAWGTNGLTAGTIA